LLTLYEEKVLTEIEKKGFASRLIFYYNEDKTRNLGVDHMYPIYYGVVIIVSVIALLSTVVIAKRVSKQEAEDDIKQLKSEKHKFNSIPLLTTIYAITFVITIVLVGIFII
jgi:hypothetical protein